MATDKKTPEGLLDYEKKALELTIKKLDWEEHLDKRERQIQYKIEAEEPLSPEEQVFITMRVAKRKQDTLDDIADKLAEIAENGTVLDPNDQ